MKTMLTAGKFKKNREDGYLAKEFNQYARNIFCTNLLLEKFETSQELKRTGLLLTRAEAKERALRTSQNMIDCNLIQNGLIVEGMLEYIMEVVNEWRRKRI